MNKTKKRTWILIRGLARESKHWGDFIDLMQNKFPQDQILPIDLPGAGEFHKMKSPSNIQKIVGFMQKTLQEKKPLYSLNLLAVSLGGMVAMEWMKQSPLQIESAVLINTSMSDLSPFYERLRWQNYFDMFIKMPFLKGTDKEAHVLKMISNKPDQHSQIAKAWHQIAVARPMRVTNIYRQLKAASSFKAPESISCHVLLLSSLGDRLVSPECSEKIREKYGFPLESHPWAGHDLAVDDGPWILSQIESWHSEL